MRCQLLFIFSNCELNRPGFLDVPSEFTVEQTAAYLEKTYGPIRAVFTGSEYIFYFLQYENFVFTNMLIIAVTIIDAICEKTTGWE